MGDAAHPPSVDALARSIGDVGLPHPLLVDAARAAIARGAPDDARAIAEETRAALLQPVVNATGVLLHTNLGRAPLGVTQEPAYTNLELDLATGKRGSRRARAGALLARACGADAALVVNNGAAAVLLALAALARDRGVAVSRGELVEVGTTNRTRRDDYSRVANDVALLLKVHRSNYRITGFTEDATVADVASIGPPVVVDLGSGLLDSACPWLASGPPAWLRDEPAVRQTLASGAALVVFSGDKLLGGPQAGVLAGRADLVDACAGHPLYRALRPGGLVLGALEQVALAYLERDGERLPFWRMATLPVDDVRRRAHAIGAGTVVDCASVTGGGTLPGIEIPSAGVALDGDVTASLRATRPKAIIARVDDNRTILDLRTVDPDDDDLVRSALSTCT